MMWFFYQHSNKAFTIRPCTLYRLGGKEFLSQHVVPLNIFKCSLIIVFSHPFSACDSYFKNKKKRENYSWGLSALYSCYSASLITSTTIRRVNKTGP